MRKAALVLATSVAFLLFGVPHSYAGIKKKVQMPTAQSVANGSGVPVKSGNSLSIPGALQGEFIPGYNPDKSTPIKVLPTIDFSIPRTINQAKGILKANAGSIVVGGVISGMIAGLDWVMSPENTSIQKKENLPVQPVYQNSYHWKTMGYGNHQGATPQLAAENMRAAYGWHSIQFCNLQSDTFWSCRVVTTPGNGFNIEIYRYGNSCAPGSTYNSSLSTCTSEQYVPVTDSDYDLIDAYVNAQNSDWLRDLLKESCNGSLSPDRCFEDLKDNTTLSGPSTVSGPSTLTTTTGPNGVISKQTKTDFKITYGGDYFIYAPTTTTTTVNPDGTTEVETEEETTEEEAQQEEIDTSIPDLYKPVIDKYDSISGDVSDAQGPGAGITWGPWYSFGGSCTEIEAQLPIIGFWSTNYCPYIYNLVRPVLMFLFVVFTWHYCKEMFQEAIEKGRPV